MAKSPVNALILIEVNVHDRVSIAGFTPHKGAIWKNQMCSKLMFIFRVAKTCQPCHYVKCSYHWANNSVNCTTSNVFRALMLVTPLLLADFKGIYAVLSQIRKCWWTTKWTTKSLEIMTFFKGFCRFPVSGHFWIRKVYRNRRNDKIPFK